MGLVSAKMCSLSGHSEVPTAQSIALGSADTVPLKRNVALARMSQFARKWVVSN